MSGTRTSFTTQHQDLATQKQQIDNIPHLVMSTKHLSDDEDSLYAPSAASSKGSLSSRFGSLAKLPLLARSKYSTNGSSRNSSSPSRGSSSPPGPSGSRQKPRGPVKSVPSGKAPVTNFADLAYRYGTPNASQVGRI